MPDQILDGNINTPKAPEEILAELIVQAERVIELYEEYNSGQEEGESDEDYEAAGTQLRSDIDTLLNNLGVNQFRNDIMFLARQAPNEEFIIELRIVLLKQLLVYYYDSEEYGDIDITPAADREMVAAIIGAPIAVLIGMVEEDIEVYTEMGAHGLKNAMREVKIKLDSINQRGE